MHWKPVAPQQAAQALSAVSGEVDKPFFVFLALDEPSANLEPVGGTTQGGSVITAMVFGAAAAGTGFFTANPTNVAALRTPGIVYVVDKRPPRGF